MTVTRNLSTIDQTASKTITILRRLGSAHDRARLANLSLLSLARNAGALAVWVHRLWSGLANLEVSRPQVCFVRRADNIRCESVEESLVGLTPKLDFSRNKAAELDDLSAMFV